ncbi:4-hydroxy-tetrahydrodipicolinate synthase [Paenibacillus sp.]|uniref:4-hydroxy-tetrahydrodipicolinate synthase n=1 Tax=Paenibacillus sp. TaxID=58172 RepID=UPI002D703BB7|nr:4-hydroxy-tetrahydrodipicolinate synthase [Paenibacillus sp.]HZG85889.1 4-hydroxy-tetrahydrodipicolinate synthase [Paenibacillus sp.]
MLRVEGVIPVLITPFTEKHELNEPALRRFVNRFIESGADGLFCLGTNGEFFSLTAEEKIRIVEIVVDETRGRVPVYAGTGGIGTKETAELSERMEAVGADALSIITPYFLPLTQQELISHYKSIASWTSLPIVLYNFPARTGVHLEPRTVAELSSIPNIVGIKDSSGSFDTILQYIHATTPDFAVLSGSDSLLLWTLAAGGKGGVSGSANVVPALMTAIYARWKNGELPAAKEAQSLLRPLSELYKRATLPSVFKEAMNMMGLNAGPCRPPIAPPEPALKEELRTLLRRYKELGYIKEEIQ